MKNMYKSMGLEGVYHGTQLLIGASSIYNVAGYAWRNANNVTKLKYASLYLKDAFADAKATFGSISDWINEEQSGESLRDVVKSKPAQ